MNSIKKLFFIGSFFLFTACADAIFEIQINDETPECLNFETNNEPIKLYAYHGADRIDEIVIGNKKIKGYFNYHPIQKEMGNRMEFPNFSIFESDECRLVLEHKGFNNKMFIVDDERVESFFLEKEKTGGNNK